MVHGDRVVLEGRMDTNAGSANCTALDTTVDRFTCFNWTSASGTFTLGLNLVK